MVVLVKFPIYEFSKYRNIEIKFDVSHRLAIIRNFLFQSQVFRIWMLNNLYISFFYSIIMYRNINSHNRLSKYCLHFVVLGSLASLNHFCFDSRNIQISWRAKWFEQHTWIFASFMFHIRRQLNINVCFTLCSYLLTMTQWKLCHR